MLLSADALGRSKTAGGVLPPLRWLWLPLLWLGPGPFPICGTLILDCATDLAFYDCSLPVGDSAGSNHTFTR